MERKRSTDKLKQMPQKRVLGGPRNLIFLTILNQHDAFQKRNILVKNIFCMCRTVISELESTLNGLGLDEVRSSRPDERAFR